MTSKETNSAQQDAVAGAVAATQAKSDKSFTKGSGLKVLSKKLKDKQPPAPEKTTPSTTGVQEELAATQPDISTQSQTNNLQSQGQPAAPDIKTTPERQAPIVRSRPRYGRIKHDFEVVVKGQKKQPQQLDNPKEQAASVDANVTNVAEANQEPQTTPASGIGENLKIKAEAEIPQAPGFAPPNFEELRRKTHEHEEATLLEQARIAKNEEAAPIETKKTSADKRRAGKSDEQQHRRPNRSKAKKHKREDKPAERLDERFNWRKPKRNKLSRAPEMADIGVFEKPTEFVAKVIDIPATITVGDLAKKMSVKARDLIPALLGMGVMKTINDLLDQDTAMLLAEEMGHTTRVAKEETIEEQHVAEQMLIPTEGGEPRAPIITVMGHVDHGKTSLLDYIRKTRVAGSEAGGITQHIGAYHVDTGQGGLTFLDTPGHADFTAMRARGAELTDLVILVVAANDGVMPQTIEAIQHAKSADVPIVVAINKIDLEEINIDRIKTELAGQDLAPEDWGGSTQCIGISALTGEGVDSLLEAIALQAELLELKAIADMPGRGYVIESRLDKGSGPVASLLINNGTLKVGDALVAGGSYGRVRAMIDEHNKRIKVAGASIPVEVLGFNNAPEVGKIFTVIESEKKARELVSFRQSQADEQRLTQQKIQQPESLFQRQDDSDKATLNIILKTDVRGSLEALQQAVQKLKGDEFQVNIVSSGVGGITESEALFAQTSQATLLGFNVRADASAKKVIEQYSLNIHYYSVIYELVDDIKNILSSMLKPKYSEEIVGTAEVRNIFDSQRYGLIAGCMVATGSVYRKKRIRVLRDSTVIYEGELESLRRIKEDVEEVKSGIECGVGIKDYKDVQVGDVIETYNVREIARTL